jgi:glyoxylate/hydroxypyruvate reductase A
MRVLFAAGAARWPQWEGPLRRAFAEAGVEVDLVRRAAPATVEAIVYAPTGDPPPDFTAFTNCRLVQSLWAGVERIVTNPTLTQPLARMVDPGLRQGMVEYVCGHVLRLHLGIDAQVAAQSGHWHQVVPPLASDRPVAVLGLGELGGACAQALAGLGFPVLGWARRPRAVPGVEVRHGAEGLRETLARARIVVTLLPATAETENLLDARRLGWLPMGAMIVNPGRGSVIDDAALLDALAAGRVAQATLDVFRVEPLPPDHPFWAHPRVTVTPHIAAETRPESAARVVAENLRRLRDGAPVLHLVDRAAGY